MGYRSNVRCLIYGEPDVVQAFWTKHKMMGNTALLNWSESIKRYRLRYNNHDRSVIDLTAESWKWYDTYDDVLAWQSLLAAIDSDHANEVYELSYEFARIGDDDADIEYRATENCVYYLGINRSIETDMPDSIQVEDTNE